jgi:hypothetical protein
LLEEPANLAGAIDEVNLQNPVALRAARIRLA